MILIIIIGLILGFIVIMTALITDSNQKQENENIKRGVKRLRALVDKWNIANVDVYYEQQKNNAVNRAKKDIQIRRQNSDFYETLVRISDVNMDNGYRISEEDDKFRIKFVENYLFNSEEYGFSIYNLIDENKIVKTNLKESCRDFLYDESKREKTVQFEYINYLFYRALDVFLKNPKNKKASKEYINRMIEKCIYRRLDSNIFYYYYIYFPMNIFDNIVKMKFGHEYDLNKTWVVAIRACVERKHQIVAFEDNVDFFWFKDIYKSFFDEVVNFIEKELNDEIIKMEKEKIATERDLKKALNRKMALEKRARLERRQNRMLLEILRNF